jgi:hypothetical protein
MLLSFKVSTMVEIFDWKEGAPNPITKEWMIAEAHNRGFEFRWLNPYRATLDLRTDILSPTMIFTNTEWMIKYGGNYDPALLTENHLIAVVDEVVRNYDIVNPL